MNIEQTLQLRCLRIRNRKYSIFVLCFLLWSTLYIDVIDIDFESHTPVVSVTSNISEAAKINLPNASATPVMSVIESITKNVKINLTRESSTNESEQITRATKIHLPMPFDAAAPPIRRGIIHILPSLPSSHRIPHTALSNTSAYFSTWNSSTSPASLFMYNPSIVPLPPSIVAKLSIVGASATNNTATYIASYRLSSVQGCLYTYDFWNHKINVFGFACLDANLDILPGSDIVVDLNKFFKQHNVPVQFEDLRLFVLHGTIYMSHESTLVPIGISNNASNIQMGERLSKGQPLVSSATLIPNMYGSGMQLFISGNVLKIGRQGKNFQFFGIPESPPGGTSMDRNYTIFMEDWVSGPRIMAQYNLGLSKNVINKTWKVQHIEAMREYRTNQLPESATVPNQKWTGWALRDRATACCVRIDSIYFRDLILPGIKQSATDQKWLGENGHILVGVAHVKKRNRRIHYLSRIYAFSPYPPYEIVARSGLMCFGIGNESATNVNNDPYAAIVRKKNDFGFKGKEFNCPRIHFVSGIVEKVGDPSKLILAYGVDDCVSRMVEINKIDFAEHLFTAPRKQG